MSRGWERAEVVAVDTPPDDDTTAQEITLVVKYPDGRVRFCAVAVRMTDKIKLSKAVTSRGET